MNIIEQLIALTKTGYSYDRYGKVAWRKNIESLLKAGFSRQQVEWIMLSKYSRWAGDAFASYDSETDSEVFDGTELMQHYHNWGFEDDKGLRMNPGVA